MKTSVLKNMVNMMNQADLLKDTLDALAVHRPHKGGAGVPSHGVVIPSSINGDGDEDEEGEGHVAKGGLLVNASVEPISSPPVSPPVAPAPVEATSILKILKCVWQDTFFDSNSCCR